VTADGDRRRIELGRIGAPHGVRGWVKIVSDTDPPENIFRYRPWLVGGERLKVLERQRNGKSLIARLEGCDDRDAAASLTNRDIAVYREQLPPPRADEFYWTDLEGMSVKTSTGQDLGRISHLFATGANDVLVVQGDRERLLPFVWDDVIQDIDFENGFMRVDWDPEF
jgi:16S rRNA processing protein RimM